MACKNNPDNKDTPVIILTEKERLRQNIYRSDMDKLRLFTKMLRTNALYNKAIVNHNKSGIP